jgi:hypothetical protein
LAPVPPTDQLQQAGGTPSFALPGRVRSAGRCGLRRRVSASSSAGIAAPGGQGNGDALTFRAVMRTLLCDHAWQSSMSDRGNLRPRTEQALRQRETDRHVRERANWPMRRA